MKEPLHNLKEQLPMMFVEGFIRVLLRIFFYARFFIVSVCRFFFAILPVDFQPTLIVLIETVNRSLSFCLFCTVENTHTHKDSEIVYFWAKERNQEKPNEHRKNTRLQEINIAFHSKFISKGLSLNSRKHMLCH